MPAWPESEVFTPLERDVLEYAEAMTSTPTTVTDDLYARLLGRLGPAAMVELTVFIGFANLAGRVNTAHGITSQGYSDACEIPLAKRPETAGIASAATVWLNGAPGGRIEVAGEPAAVSLAVENGRVTRVFLVRNPRKLTRLDEPTEVAR